MIPAPFTAAQAASVLGSLAAIFIAVGGIALMFAGPRRYVKRALLLGVVLAVMAGSAGSIFV